MFPHVWMESLLRERIPVFVTARSLSWLLARSTSAPGRARSPAPIIPATVVLVGRPVSRIFVYLLISMEDDVMKSLVSPFHIRLPFTVPLALRYVFITLLLTGFVLGAWSGITPIAHAATHAAAAPKHAAHHTGSQRSHPSQANTSAIP